MFTWLYLGPFSFFLGGVSELSLLGFRVSELGFRVSEFRV